ncbi:MAG: succinate dehydrogenase cytochrome b subunit [Bacteroidetes bacterium]|nr:succinate dehydrogenase cytochrome b subunit [Bacteroidota bacterium]MBU1680198.1 succinate dehydrogenase cytochrome b subunit [Bacteroidota bacterium]MBU2505409.1 succinate dehydrogenase cytochrome b subunit [Bacteroidota bacterium]
MGWLIRSINSSIGKKFIMALTGLSLILFLAVHLIGNLTLYWGPEAFNGYVQTLDVVKPIIRVVEVILALVFISHIFYGVWLWIINKIAKAGKYAVNASSKNSSVYSRTAIISGSIIFIFLVLHLSTIWFAFNFGYSPSDAPHEYYNMLIVWFKDPIYSGFYVIAVILLAFHLNHGFQSAFQTLGWNHTKYFPFIKFVGSLYALIMGVGFASFPIYFYFFSGGNL